MLQLANKFEQEHKLIGNELQCCNTESFNNISNRKLVLLVGWFRKIRQSSGTKDLKKFGIDTCLLLFFKDQCIIIMSLQHCSPTQGEPVPSGSHSSRQRTQGFTVNGSSPQHYVPSSKTKPRTLAASQPLRCQH